MSEQSKGDRPSSRGNFHTAQRFDVMSKADNGSQAIAFARTLARGAQLQMVAQAHYARHRENWIERAHVALIQNDKPTPTLIPPGMQQDRNTILKHTATRLVEQRQAQRVQRIERAMLNTLDRIEGRAPALHQRGLER